MWRPISTLRRRKNHSNITKRPVHDEAFDLYAPPGMWRCSALAMCAMATPHRSWTRSRVRDRVKFHTSCCLALESTECAFQGNRMDRQHHCFIGEEGCTPSRGVCLNCSSWRPGLNAAPISSEARAMSSVKTGREEAPTAFVTSSGTASSSDVVHSLANITKVGDVRIRRRLQDAYRTSMRL